jgi:hypothetical protein
MGDKETEDDDVGFDASGADAGRSESQKDPFYAY